MPESAKEFVDASGRIAPGGQRQDLECIPRRTRFARSDSIGISLRQGAHHVAQKLSKTCACPDSSAKAAVLCIGPVCTKENAAVETRAAGVAVEHQLFACRRSRSASSVAVSTSANAGFAPRARGRIQESADETVLRIFPPQGQADDRQDLEHRCGAAALPPDRTRSWRRSMRRSDSTSEWRRRTLPGLGPTRRCWAPQA